MATQLANKPPGLLRAHADPDVVMMLCTAGHVDHGKTRLVKMLTGCSTDRLKAEQERGLTIELGFAPCVLGGDICAGIVDVPGHEKFVKNMVAGVSGIAMCILVIAADDGIMPQTIEHMQIMELLGVRHGIVAVTKTDRVDAARVAEVSAEVRTFIRGSFLEGAPLCPLSSETGDGISYFYTALVAAIRALPRPRQSGIFRMPIERTFTQHGFGAVVTGIPVSGIVRVEDVLELVPGGARGRVRSIQRFLRNTQHGGAGQCLALNVPEFGKAEPVRGQVLCLPGYLCAARCFQLRLRVLPGLPDPIKHGQEVKFHTGTSETPGRLYVLNGEALAAGTEHYATLVTAAPVAAAAGDRFLLRSPSPARTIAGGIIAGCSPEANRPRIREARAFAALHAQTTGHGCADDSGQRMRAVAFHLRAQAPWGAPLAAIGRATLLTEAEAADALAALEAAGEVARFPEGIYIHGTRLEEALQHAEARLTQLRAEGRTLSLSRAEFQQGQPWPAALWNHVLGHLSQRGLLRVRADRVLLQGPHGGLGSASSSDAALAERVLRLYEETEFRSPRPEDLPSLLSAPEKAVARILDYLCDEGSLVRLGKHVVLAQGAMRQAQELVVKHIEAHGQLDSADFKYSINSSRKYALAILDFLDARQVTVRFGNNRKLTANYRERLL